VVIGYPAPNHYLACYFYASLTTAKQKVWVTDTQPPIVLVSLARDI